MSDVHDQVHGRFRILSGPSIEALLRQAESFVSEGKLAPKSIGVEYLEAAKAFVLSLGYRTDEPGYEVTFSHHPLCRVDSLADLGAVETAMARVAAGVAGIICHELYVDDHHQFFAIVMSLKG
jgi:hypothetical protein